MYIYAFITLLNVCVHIPAPLVSHHRSENFVFLMFSWCHFEEPGKVILIKNTALQGVDLIFSFGFQVLFDVSNFTHV